jgi:ATP-binding cassette, subfamily B (MDR/TAP), member 1
MRDGTEPNEEDQLRQDGKSKSWKAIFIFTKRGHVLAVIPAMALSAAGGALGPVMAIFLGRFLDAFADFESGKISPDKLMERTLKSVYALLGIGIGNILLEGGLFFAWLSFGEMQAKSVRDDLFQALLQKDLEWFEMRESGVGALLTRLQTYFLSLLTW